MADEAAPGETTDPAAPAAATVRTAGEGFLASALAPTEEPDDWSPPKTRDDGIALDEHNLPVNRRLRMIELSDSGKSEDPAGVVSAEEIAATGKRLAAYDKERPPITSRTSVADLAAMADKEGIAVPEGIGKTELAELIATARPPRI